MPKSRKKRTEEFKREAVRAMELRGERTVADVAKSLGVPENVLHNWPKVLGSQIADTSEETPEQELKRLPCENSKLKLTLKREREILITRLANTASLSPRVRQRIDFELAHRNVDFGMVTLSTGSGDFQNPPATVRMLPATVRPSPYAVKVVV